MAFPGDLPPDQAGTGDTLFRRTYLLVLGTHDVTGMHIKFRVEKTLQAKPGTCSIDVYNLAPETRESLEKAASIPVRLEAGYADENELIYLGRMRSATSVTEGPDITTHVESADGEQQIQTARVATSVAPGSSAGQVLSTLAGALGLGLGNTDATAKAIAGLPSPFPAGRVVTGNASKELTDLTNSAGLEWSVQNGNLQFLAKNKALTGKSYLLSPNSGLIGSPSVDSKGVVNAQSLFIPGIRPGSAVVFDSRSIQGGYRVQKVIYTGDFAGKDWYCELECKRIT